MWQCITLLDIMVGFFFSFLSFHFFFSLPDELIRIGERKKKSDCKGESYPKGRQSIRMERRKRMNKRKQNKKKVKIEKADFQLLSNLVKSDMVRYDMICRRLYFMAKNGADLTISNIFWNFMMVSCVFARAFSLLDCLANLF